MPPKPKGNVFESRGKRFARVRISATERPAFMLSTCATESQADARGAVLADLTAKLRAAPGVSTETARGILERAACA